MTADQFACRWGCETPCSSVPFCGAEANLRPEPDPLQGDMLTLLQEGA